MKIRIPDWFAKYWIWLAAGVIAGFYAVITRWGVIVGFDSYYYLASAQGILDGHGIGWVGADGVFVPLTHYPPLYPLLVALVSFVTGSTVLQGARILMLLSVFIISLCIGKVIQKQTIGFTIPLAGMGIVVTLSPLLNTLTAAMTEGLFLALFCGLLLSLTVSPGQIGWRRHLLPIFLIAAMLLLRFAAAAVLAAYLVSILLEDQSEKKERLKKVGLVGFTTIIPLGVWLWSRSGLGDVTGRRLMFHPPGITQYQLAWVSIQEWFVPVWDRLPVHILASVGLVLIILGFTYLRIKDKNEKEEKKRQSRSPFTSFLLCYLIIYPVFLWFSYAFVDASTRWTDRILSPWLFCWMTWLGLAIWTIVKDRITTKAGIVLVAGVLIWFTAQGVFATIQSWSMFVEGDGFTSRTYQNSELIKKIRQAENNLEIFTNNPALLYFTTGKTVSSIPERKNTIDSQRDPAYKDQLVEMQAKILDGKAILVVIKPYDMKNGVYPKIEVLTAQLTQVFKTPEGVIYQ